MSKRLAGIVLAAVMVVSACGDAESTEAASPDEVESPIAEFLGQPSFFGGDSEAAEAQFVEEERARQETIAECMQEQGFEYIPQDPDQFFFFEADGELEYGSDEWVAKYGFGISTQRFSQSELGPDLVGYDDSGFEEQMNNDPNQAIVEAMSEAEQEAYYEALYGDEDDFPVFDETLSEEEIEAQMEDFEFEPAGCEGKAYSEDSANAFYQEFGDELDELYQRIEADPRIAEAEREVGECVGERGLDYDGMENLYERFEADLAEVDAGVSYPGEELTEDDFAQLSEAELDEIFSQPVQLTDEAKTKLAEIQAEEIELAMAVNECGGSFEDQQALYAEVVVEYEQQFLDDNADRLADFKAE